MKLNGKNLGERQHDFNSKVTEAITKKIDFALVRDDPVDTDIDQLFRIDIASRLKDVPFLLQTFVSGDSLHITRALKSVWLFDDEYQHIMNPDYLSKNIFPHMSSKMLKKLLTTASMWIKNEERAENFYLYCKENGMDNFALKFLFYTSEAFKENVLQIDFKMLRNFEEKKLQLLIGRSFILADLYRSNFHHYTRTFEVIYKLRFLYSVNSDKFLDILETYTYKYNTHRFGLRISTDILKRYKERILKRPQSYLTTLNKNVIAKYSNSEDAKLYLKLMLSDINNVTEFWIDFMQGLDFIIKIIPLSEIYDFLKKLYVEKFKTELEMTIEWFRLRCYKYMTEAQQEQWALEQLSSKNEILGAGQDFLWYNFIRFDLSFEEIKKLILITKNDDKRLKMLCVLVECAKNEVELEKLLTYFYTRHGNEIISRKLQFLDCVNSNHNVFNFREDCWNAINRILYSLDVYNAQNGCVNNKMIASFYHILHGITLPEVLRCFVGKLSYLPQPLKSKIEQYNQNGLVTVYKYILNIQLEDLSDLEKQEYNDEVRIQARAIIMSIETVRFFQKTEDLPEIVTKFKKLDAETFFPKKPLKTNKKEFERVTPKDLMRILKKDATLVSNFDLLEKNIQFASKFNIKELLQKLRIYFHEDTAQQYTEYFKKAYSKEDSKIIFISVYGILLLADDKFKQDFILQHTPEDPKVKYDEIDRNLLYIREAICRFACYSRPPIEIDNILPYIKGDYLKYCLPMFNVYMTRYPPAIRDKFVKSLLNTPVSIQKHGVRLAFQCFKKKELMDLILNSWKKYQNVSLRMVIYEYVMSSVKKNEDTRNEMFEVLKKITLNLKEDECEDVIKIVKSSRNLPDELKGCYFEAVWTAISKFSDCKINIDAKADVLFLMVANFSVTLKEIVKTIVTHHVDVMLFQNSITDKNQRSNYRRYDEAARVLTYKFICIYCRDEDTLELVKYIVQKCVEGWNDVRFYFSDLVFVFRRFCSDFLENLINNDYAKQNTVEFNRVLETVLTYLTDSVPNHEIFFLTLNLKVVMLTNRVIEYSCKKYKNCKIDDGEADDIAKEYHKELEILMKDMIKNNFFTKAFLHDLGEIIANNVGRMAGCLFYRLYTREKLLIFISSNLADSSTSEIVLLSVAIMPDYYPDDEWQSYSVLFDKISKIESDEVKYMMNIKSAKNRYKVMLRI